MVKLDGIYYSIHLTNYKHQQTKYATTEVSHTGAVVHVDSGVFTNKYNLTLICTTDEIATLRGSFAKANFTNSALDFWDEEGHQWIASTGSDSATVTYSSGVYFDGDIEPQPMNTRGWSVFNRFQVPIVLYVNAGGLSGSGSGGSGGGLTMVHEVPGGTINGVNVTFTLIQTPSTQILFRNGVEQKLSVNYTVSGSTITFLAGSIPQTGDSLDCYYTV